MSIRAIAFDLGNTLVEYYQREAFPSVLSESVRSAHAVLSGYTPVSVEQSQAIALSENTEQPDGKVRPLQERFDRIFGWSPHTPEAVRSAACEAFLNPIFKRARKYRDSDSTLRRLREQGYRLAIVSNTPFGSPSPPWRQELERHSLKDAVDASVFCVEVGWRKPARVIFDHVLQLLNVNAEECLFIGDEPAWDVEGARAAGMPAFLIDRTNKHSSHNGIRIQTLEEISALIERPELH